MNIINGNILDGPSNINVIIHQANTKNVMGAGIALALKNKWPQVFDVDKNHYDHCLESTSRVYDNIGYAKEKVEQERLGQFSWCNIEFDDGRRGWCVNLYGQRLGRQTIAGSATDYNAVVAGFQRVRRALESNNNAEKFHIGIPYMMGCGLGGGNWDIYSAIIQSVLIKNAPFKVTIVKYDG